MSVRVFNKKWTRRLEAVGNPNDFMILKPLAFADVPEKYTGDITFRLGVQSGDIEVFETKKQGEAIEAKAAENTEKQVVEKSEAEEAEAKPVKKGGKGKKA